MASLSKAWTSLLVAASASPAWADEPAKLYFPQGTTQQLGTLVGSGTQMAGCAVWDIQAKGMVATVTYGCGAAGEARVLVTHPNHPGEDALVTEHFNIYPGEPTPSAALMDALRTRILAHEGTWRWLGEEPHTAPPPSAPASPPPKTQTGSLWSSPWRCWQEPPFYGAGGATRWLITSPEE